MAEQGRKVSGKRFVWCDGRPSFEEFTDGRFITWGMDFEELEGGPVNYTTAIIELPDGQVITTRPDHIKFEVE